MYRYARTKNRVHRVIVEGGKAFKIEQCNLDDAAFFRLEDITPEGQHCAYCWAGYVEPTPEEQQAKDQEVKQFTESPQSKAVPIVQSTRRMAAAILVGALLLGAATGVVASPKELPKPTADLDALRSRIDDLFVQVHVLQVDIDAHVHAIPSNVTPIPFVIVLPTANPIDTQPVINPSPTPVVPASSPSGDTGSTSGSSGKASGSTDTHSTTTIIVIPASTQAPGINQTGASPPPVSTPAPTPPPAPTPTPCVRPGTALGAGDPCRWPHN